jgi:hypothetical protein
MREEQFGFRPRHSTSLQLAGLFEKITRIFGEKKLTGAVFVDMAKTFVTVWIDGLLYELTLLKFPSYTVHTNSAYPPVSDVRNVLPYGHVISSRHSGWSGSWCIDFLCPLSATLRFSVIFLSCKAHARIYVATLGMARPPPRPPPPTRRGFFT